MKLDPHLPSIGELLEHPRVKGVVARINRSTLAHRAAGFLEELRSSVAERAGRVEVPSVTQLAERLARRLLGEPVSGGPVINATGVVVGDRELTPPLADTAVHAMMQVASEYHPRDSQFQRSAEIDLCHLAGAEAALVVSSFDAALNIVLASTMGGREIVVSERTSPPGACIDWRKLTARHGVILQAVDGNLDSLTAAASGRQLAALIRAPEAEELASTTDVAAIARKVGANFIDVYPLSGVLNPAAYALQSTETLRERIEAGADLVIADGAGLLGGPACGVIVGKRGLIEAAAAHYLASIAAIDAVPAAGLQATLAAYRDGDGSAVFAIPVWQLLSAPLANLKQRAERLAALISRTGNVASAEPREVQGPWRCIGKLHVAANTWVVEVRPKTGDAAALLSNLRQRPYPIAAADMNGAIHLDLRSVFPRWDQQLVAAFEATPM